MKDVIKEILDEMYHIICTYSDDYDYFEENGINFELSYKDMEKLYDYITNLQEENERLSVELNKNMIERNNYLSRNEKAIEYLPEIRRTPSYELDEKIDNLENILQGDDKSE